MAIVFSSRESAREWSPDSSIFLPSSVRRSEAARCGGVEGVIFASSELSSGTVAGGGGDGGSAEEGGGVRGVSSWRGLGRGAGKSSSRSGRSSGARACGSGGGYSSRGGG